MKIIKYSKEFEEDVKDLLVELQEYIVSIDNWHLNIITPEYREMYFKKTMEDCSKNDGIMFLAVEDDKVLGMICGHLVERDEYDKYDYTCPKSGVIEELIVSKKTRRGGVGYKLIDKIENYFKSLGCEYCHVDVFEPNEIGKNFYKKAGQSTCNFIIFLL